MRIEGSQITANAVAAGAGSKPNQGSATWLDAGGNTIGALSIAPGVATPTVYLPLLMRP